MIGYVTLGTRDLEGHAKFYDALLAVLGASRQMSWPTGIAWGRNRRDVMLGLCLPFDGQPPSVGNGVMVALAARSPEQVQALHAQALALGGQDEGAPGDRGGGFYAAYFRDLDGNKLNAFCKVKDEHA